MKKIINSSSVPYLIIGLFVLPVITPLFSKGILGSADNLAHLFRTVNLDKVLTEGYLFSRWLPLEGHGLGAPVFNFNYLLPYYLTEAFHLSGFGFLSSSQLFTAMSLIFSAVFMHLFITELWGKGAGIIAAIVYTYVPYHLLSLYLYGDWGEILSFAMLPLFLFVMTKIGRSGGIRSFILGTAVFSLFILTHNLFVLLASLVVLTFIPLIWDRKIASLIDCFLVFLFGSLLTSWFWFPAIVESQLIRYTLLAATEGANRNFFFASVSPVIENSLKLLRLETPGYYTFALGIPTLVIGIISFAVLLRFYFVRKRESRKLLIFGLFWFWFSLFLTRKSSGFLWEEIPGMGIVAYPYRFFFLNTFATAFLAGFLIHKLLQLPRLPKILKITTLIVTILSFVWQSYMYTRPKIDYFQFPASYFTTAETALLAPWTYKNMGYVEFLPRSANPGLLKNLDNSGIDLPKVEIIEGKGAVKTLGVKTEEIPFTLTTQTPVTVRINTFYFPGWTIKAGETLIHPVIDSDGRMLIKFLPGSYQASVFFTDTPVRTAGKMLSTASLVLLSIVLFLKMRQHHQL